MTSGEHEVHLGALDIVHAFNKRSVVSTACPALGKPGNKDVVEPSYKRTDRFTERHKEAVLQMALHGSNLSDTLSLKCIATIKYHV